MAREAITPTSTVVVSDRQVSRDVGEEAVILGLDESVYYGLNPVGARIWSLIQEPHAISDLCDTIQQEYDVDSETCRRDVVELLERLAREKLIEVRP